MKHKDNNDLWTIKADTIDQNNYFGAMVANGIIGIVSGAKPFQIREVILNGVYDRYQRGRVSNILKAFNPFNLDLFMNDKHVSSECLTDYAQELNMKQASFNSYVHLSVMSTIMEPI